MSALSAKLDARDGEAAAAVGHAAPQQLPYPELTLADFGDSLLPLLPLVRQARRPPRVGYTLTASGVLGTGGFGAVFEASIYGGSVPVTVKVTRRGGRRRRNRRSAFCGAAATALVSLPPSDNLSLPSSSPPPQVLKNSAIILGDVGACVRRRSCSTRCGRTPTSSRSSGCAGTPRQASSSSSWSDAPARGGRGSPTVARTPFFLLSLFFPAHGHLGSPGSVKIADFVFARVAQVGGWVGQDCRCCCPSPSHYCSCPCPCCCCRRRLRAPLGPPAPSSRRRARSGRARSCGGPRSCL